MLNYFGDLWMLLRHYSLAILNNHIRLDEALATSYNLVLAKFTIRDPGERVRGTPSKRVGKVMLQGC